MNEIQFALNYILKKKIAMKNHKKLIRLIIITATLMAIGVFAFKYMQTYKNLEQVYQNHAMQDETNKVQSNVTSGDDVIIQASDDLPSDIVQQIAICNEPGTPGCEQLYQPRTSNLGNSTLPATTNRPGFTNFQQNKKAFHAKQKRR